MVGSESLKLNNIFLSGHASRGVSERREKVQANEVKGKTLNSERGEMWEKVLVMCSLRSKECNSKHEVLSCNQKKIT